MAIAGQGIDVGTFRDDIGDGIVGESTHVTVGSNLAARVLQRPLVAVLPVDRG